MNQVFVYLFIYPMDLAIRSEVFNLQGNTGADPDTFESEQTQDKTKDEHRECYI